MLAGKQKSRAPGWTCATEMSAFVAEWGPRGWMDGRKEPRRSPDSGVSTEKWLPGPAA